MPQVDFKVPLVTMSGLKVSRLDIYGEVNVFVHSFTLVITQYPIEISSFQGDKILDKSWPLPNQGMRKELTLFF